MLAYFSQHENFVRSLLQWRFCITRKIVENICAVYLFATTPWFTTACYCINHLCAETYCVVLFHNVLFLLTMILLYSRLRSFYLKRPPCDKNPEKWCFYLLYFTCFFTLLCFPLLLLYCFLLHYTFLSNTLLFFILLRFTLFYFIAFYFSLFCFSLL